MERALLGCAFLLGILTFSAIAQAQNQSDGTQAPQDTAPDSSATPSDKKTDKSQFNLFNPTPEEDLRPFSTDRPGKTHSSLTVDAGHFQLEGDFYNYTWDHWSNDGSKTRAYTLINPNLKLGVTNWAELDVFLPRSTTASKSKAQTALVSCAPTDLEMSLSAEK